MIQKLANIIEMVFKIPESEKELARQALELTQKLGAKLKQSEDYLDIIYDPLKKFENLDGEKLVEKQGLFVRFKNKSKENYEELMEESFKLITLLKYFENDTKMAEIISSLNSELDKLKKQVEDLFDSLDNLEGITFQTDAVGEIENIQKTTEQLKNYLDDRINNYLTKNVLAENWINDIENKLNSKIEQKIPLITQLYNERQQALDGGMPQIMSREPVLNPALNQRMWGAKDERESEYIEPHEDGAQGYP